MSRENINYYEYNGDIDLDEQTLYEYVNHVNQQTNVQKMINNVVPTNPKTFGQAVEPFESKKELVQQNQQIQYDNSDYSDYSDYSNSNSNSKEQTNNYFKWFVFMLLLLLALYYLFNTKSSCGNKKHDIFIADKYPLDSATPDIGSEFKAMFVR